MDYKSLYSKWLNSNVITKEERKRLSNLSEKKMEEMFTGKLEFGTAGMRGIMDLGEKNINVYTIRKATKGLADFIISEKKKGQGVAISYDTRHNSYLFASEAAAVLAYNKIKVYLFEDVRPVAMLSFAIRQLNCAAGIMITASHNPKQYNGYKVYGSDGAQLSLDDSKKIGEFIDKTDDIFSVDKIDISDSDIAYSASGLSGKNYFDYINIIGNEIDNAYFETIENLSVCRDLKHNNADLKIVYSPLYGAGYKPITTVLTRTGINFNVVKEQCLPDGNFPTVSSPNPEQADALALGIKEAASCGADCVIATDPDCDRMGVAVKDREGNFVLLNGNTIGVLLADYILKLKSGSGKLPADAVIVKTIVTTELARRIAEYYGAKCIDVLTGFKFIGEKIKQFEENGEHSFIFGFEESYGYLCGTYARDKDAVSATMLFAEMVKFYKGLNESVLDRLESIYKIFGYYREENIVINYPGINGMNKMESIMERIRKCPMSSMGNKEIISKRDYNSGLEFKYDKVYPLDLPKTNAIYFELQGGAFVCIRPSGTEPKLKVYISAKSNDKNETDKIVENLKTSVAKLLGKKINDK